MSFSPVFLGRFLPKLGGASCAAFFFVQSAAHDLVVNAQAPQSARDGYIPTRQSFHLESLVIPKIQYVFGWTLRFQTSSEVFAGVVTTQLNPDMLGLSLQKK
jgi:hypothetical protein